MTEITLLSKEDLYGEIFKKILKKCLGTDFTGDETRIMGYWTKSLSGFGIWSNAVEFYVGSTGELTGSDAASGYGVRPVLYLTSSDFDEIVKNAKTCKNSTKEVVYGEYPQKKVKNSKELDDLYGTKILNGTGKTYTIPENINRKEHQLKEYEYAGKKYVLKGNRWIEVTPIEWIVDEENHRLISKRVLLGNVPLNLDNPEYNGNFDTSSMYSFLNNQFLKEIIPSNIVSTKRDTNTEDLDEEIARLEEEIAGKQELIRQYKQSRVELLTAESQALDEEIALLEIKELQETGRQFVKQPLSAETNSNK